MRKEKDRAMNTKNAFLAAATLATIIGCRQPGVEMPYNGGYVTIRDTCEPQIAEAQRQRFIIVRDAQHNTLVIKDVECDGNILQNRVYTLKDGDTVSPLFSKDEVRIIPHTSGHDRVFKIYHQEYREVTDGVKITRTRLTDVLSFDVRKELETDINAQFTKAQRVYDEILKHYQSTRNAS